MNRPNYIFVDFESIQEVDLDLIADKPVVVILVLGKQQKKLPLKLVQKLVHYSSQIRLVETKCGGENALDFVLAYLIGEQTVAERNGYFHILSRDKGYDALIDHLRDHAIFAARHEEFGKIPILQNEPPALDERVSLLTSHFSEHKANRPKKEKALRSHVHARFGKKLSEAELNATIKALVAGKVIGITAQGAVSYNS